MFTIFGRGEEDPRDMNESCENGLTKLAISLSIAQMKIQLKNNIKACLLQFGYWCGEVIKHQKGYEKNQNEIDT